MKVVIIYDSKYSNTAKVANAMLSALNQSNVTRLVLAEDASGADLHEVDVLVVGSPTQGGRPTQHIQRFMDNLHEGVLKNIRIAVFDTRFAIDEHGPGLELLMKTMGFAAPHMAAGLGAKGGILAIEPEGFIVQGKEGPLKKGELERARQWAKSILASVK